MKNYVKVFNGHEVPEGSTHQASDTSFVLFAKWIGNHPVFFDVRNDSWVEDKLIGRHFFKELPEAEWEPVFGEECEVWHGEEWMKCLLIGKGLEDHYIYQLTEVYRFELNGDHDLKAFRPLKTQHEKDREAFFEKALVVSKKLSIDDFLSELFDVGFTAPKDTK
jgi:hypothetical protein